MPFSSNFRRQMPFKDDRAALIELLRVKKNINAFHENEWMKEHNYALQNADTRPRLQRRTQNISFVISTSAVILKLMVKITSVFGSYRFLKIAWHDTFSLSHYLLASWNLFIPRVAESKNKCSSSCQVQRLDESKALELKSTDPQVNHRTHLKDSYVS